jgi:hypothetical protein
MQIRCTSLDDVGDSDGSGQGHRIPLKPYVDEYRLLPEMDQHSSIRVSWEIGTAGAGYSQCANEPLTI